MNVGGAPWVPSTWASAVPVPICADFEHFDTAVVSSLHDGKRLPFSLNPLLKRTVIELLVLGMLPLMRFPVKESNDTPTPRGALAVPATGGVTATFRSMYSP